MNNSQTKGVVYARLALRTFQAAILLWVGWAIFSNLPEIRPYPLAVVFSIYCGILALRAAWEWKWGPSSTTIYVIEMDEQGFRSGRRGQGPVVPWTDVTEIQYVGRVLTLGPISRYFFDGGLTLHTESGARHTLRFGQCADPRATYDSVVNHLCQANPPFQDGPFKSVAVLAGKQIRNEHEIWRSLRSDNDVNADSGESRRLSVRVLGEFTKQTLLPLVVAFALAVVLLKNSRLGPVLTWDLILLATVVFGYMILDIRLPKFLRSVDLLFLAFFTRAGKDSPLT